MATHPLSDSVSRQYERWRYPEPIFDLKSWLTTRWQWFDPGHAHRIFWPDREYKPDMDILVAGCGTNQAAVLAYTNPDAKIVAIDVSQSSLDHHWYLKSKYGLKNLELYLLAIENLSTLNRDFDLIIATGVLHHLSDPLQGMKTLARCLRKEGVLATMVYARYGRIGVEMLQSVFRDLGLDQTDTSLLIVKDALSALPQNHPLKSYLSLAPDLGSDAGLIDTFLHGREHRYSIEECLDLVSSAGLVFQDLFFKAPYSLPSYSSGPFYSSVSALPERKQWSIMERINFRNACHFFMACRTERPQQNYKIDLASETFLDYVPSLRYRCVLKGRKLMRHDWRISLNAQERQLVVQMDGRRTIKEIFTEVSQTRGLVKRNRAKIETLGKTLFQSLWNLDFLALSLKLS